ncbi:hypothetical protein ACFOYW_00370 [Gryllotalpicola reticulitermitis]|uniref:ABC-2 type transport system permease protein n=1 Tax=Gryllotalpicola reticulitermitis TaxID=1184153 RepID=A0ABV8Q0A3_9MICO
MRALMWSLYGIVFVVVGTTVVSVVSGRTPSVGTRVGDVLGSQNITVGTATVGVSLAAFAAVILGVLTMTSEYGTSRPILATFAAAPQRGRVLAAKITALASAVAISSTAALTVTDVLSAALVHAHGWQFRAADPAVLLPLALSALSLVVMSVVGFAFGAALRATAGALSAAVITCWGLGPIAAIAASALNTPGVANIDLFTPETAAQFFYGFTLDWSARTEAAAGGTFSLTLPAEAVVVGGWVALAAGISYLCVRLRDA